MAGRLAGRCSVGYLHSDSQVLFSSRAAPAVVLYTFAISRSAVMASCYVLIVSVLFVASSAVADPMSARFLSCQQDSLTKCTDPLKVLTNNRDLGFAASQQELNALCPRLIDGLHCIDNFTMRCLDAQHREFFHMLYAGTKQVIVDLCQDPDYQQEYLSHAPCMRIVQTGYERCAVEYQSHVREHSGQSGSTGSGGSAVAGGANNAGDDPVENSKKLCCSFQNYMKCSQSVVEATCGAQTAAFTRGFLDTMAGPLIQGYCLSYEPGTEEQQEAECEMYQQRQQHEQDASTYAEVDQALDRRSGVVNGDETEYVPPPSRRPGTSSAAPALTASVLTLATALLLSSRVF